VWIFCDGSDEDFRADFGLLDEEPF